MEQLLETYNKFIYLFLIWEMVWKGLSLWKAARHGQRNWYIAILVLNTIGIVPIVYLKFFQKKETTSKK